MAKTSSKSKKSKRPRLRPGEKPWYGLGCDQCGGWCLEITDLIRHECVEA